jgi:AraC family transcriptional regulator of adaptative response/methylated-DNA-[protein]-cysteine methyltransferase
MPIDPDAAWQQILARDRDAEFIYGVTTTGVFCRPGCASRRPLRKNVRIFSTETQARTAGFRPCKRCCGTIASREPVSEIRNYIESHADRAVSLAELAKLVKLSPFTVQRLFKQQMGVSPLQYQRALRAGALRGALKQGETVTNAIYNAGFSSSSRAYEGSRLLPASHRAAAAKRLPGAPRPRLLAGSLSAQRIAACAGCRSRPQRPKQKLHCERSSAQPRYSAIPHCRSLLNLRWQR